MYFRRTTVTLLLVLTGLLFILSGCSGNKPAPTGAQPATIKVGMMPIIDNLPFWLAEEKGYFKAEGIKVELIPFPSALERDSAFVAGKIDAGIGDLLAVAAMVNSGTEVKAVSVGQGATPGENRFAILSAPGSGIITPTDLINVPIALSLNTINEYITDNLLAAESLQPGEISKTNMVKLPLRLDALLQGQVKAAVLPDPLATLAEIKGAHVVVDNTKNTVAQTVIIVHPKALDTNLEGIQKLVRAYTKAVEDLQEDPRQYAELIVEKARVPQEVMDSREHPLALHFTLPQLPDKAGVERTISWMKKHNLLQKEIQYDDLVDRRVISK
ncbi:ABC transporter substrate-binding protein [Desulfolucanica intricata]|uniref:ABC transporter substrate-binding protein n=1 Tax=Desulfolucanica intricata TaxID=1285191 RepID=UPI000836D9CF|nr:MetQ/NlpA family ABC transporter substrate-binding protein [Desulfolucanica intricata]